MSHLSEEKLLNEIGEFIPDFLTASYFESILQKYNRDDTLKVHSVQIGPCGAAGDAFASTMYRVKIHATQREAEKTGNFVIKMMPTLQLARNKLGKGSFDVHEKEMEIFQNIFPKMRKILKTVSDDKNIFPKAIAVDRVRGVLMLEDLMDKHFVMADRKIGLDLDHLKLGLQKLAKFHASSMVLLEKSPEKFKGFDIGMLSRNAGAFHDFMRTNLDALTDELSTWDGFEKYVPKLNSLKENFFENCFRVFDNEPGQIKVLIHGDLWVNNLMFNYHKNGSLKDCIIVSSTLNNCKS